MKSLTFLKKFIGLHESSLPDALTSRTIIVKTCLIVEELCGGCLPRQADLTCRISCGGDLCPDPPCSIITSLFCKVKPSTACYLFRLTRGVSILYMSAFVTQALQVWCCSSDTHTVGKCIDIDSLQRCQHRAGSSSGIGISARRS